MMLENPIWEGMKSGNKYLTEGDHEVRYFPATISPFAGLAEFTTDQFRKLYDMLAHGSVRATFTPTQIEVPAPWIATRRMQILQMIHRDPVADAPINTDIIALGNSDIPEMVALTALTNPGPFHQRTIEFGNYHGIRKNGQLIAMAGFRLQPGDHIEISAVCTRPGYTGKGYASMLLIKLIADIYSKGKTPILHVKKDYAAAIRLYETTGFVGNQDLHVVEFKKN